MDVNEVLDVLTRVSILLGETSVEKQSPHPIPAIHIVPISEGQKLRRQAELADDRDQLIQDVRSCLRKLNLWAQSPRAVAEDEVPGMKEHAY